MTLLQIDLTDALDEFHPDDKVVVWSPVHREGARGQVVNTRPKRIPLSSGKAEEEVEPGPLMVKIQCMGLSDTQEKEVLVPDQESVTLWDLLEQDFTYTPPIISEVVEARSEVREAVARVGSAEQVGEWAERSETAASDALTIKNSIPATVQSEVDTRVPPKVAEVIGGDTVVRDAAAAAVVDAVDAAMPSKADTTYVDRADQELSNRLTSVEPVSVETPSETAWAHATESGHRLPLGYSSDGRLDAHARRVFREDVSQVYDSASSSDLVHATISDDGHLIIGVHRDGRVTIPGLGAVREGYSVYHRDGDLLPAVTDTANLVGWGSSTMARAAPYLQAMANSVGATYHDGGKGAEQGENTAARIGATPVYVTFPDNLIPASGPVTAIEATVPGNNFMKPYEATIAGVHGLMESVSNDWTFTRTDPGDPVPVEPGTPAVPVLGATQRASLNLLNIGKNTFRDDRPWATEQIIQLTDDAFDWLSPLQKKSLVIGHFVNSDVADDAIERQQIMDVMDHQKARYGRLYVDLYALVTTDLVWKYTGLTPTDEDLELQARGNLPPSLTEDGGHLNDLGNRAFSQFLLDHMISLGWY